MAGINSLFDPKRKALVEDALKKGDLGPVFRHKPLAEPEAGAGTAKDEASGIMPSLGNIHILMLDHPQYEIRGIKYTATELLILAIMHNDVGAADIALSGNAKYDSEYSSMPPDPTDANPAYKPVLIESTPSDLANQRGLWAIANLIDMKRLADKARK